MRRGQLLRGVLIGSTAVFAVSSPASAYSQQRSYRVDIPAQDLVNTLTALARLTRQQIAFDGAVVRGKTSRPVTGEFTPDEAVGHAIEGTGLSMRRAGNGLIIITSAPAGKGASLRQRSRARTEPVRLAARAGQADAVQESASDASVADVNAADEIIVTARRREESLQQVPVVATALTADQLEARAADDLYRIADQVPGLLIGTGVGSFGNQISMRGIGASVLNATIDQSISLSVDGLQLSQGLAYTAALFDTAQVTVLKGPQALFYGKASPGGVISVDSADPSDETEVIARAGYEFEADQGVGELIVSGPVSDSLGLRVAARYSDAQGFFRNHSIAEPGTGAVDPKYRRIANSDELILRGTALWRPSDVFQAKLKLTYVEMGTDGSAGDQQYISCPDGTASFTGKAFLGGEDCVLDRKQGGVNLDPAAFPLARNGGVPYLDNWQIFGTLDMKLDVSDGLSLQSISGYYEIDQSALFNGSNSTAAGPALAAQPRFSRRDMTQEIRLVSDYAGSPVNFMLGGFYQDGRMAFDVDVLGNTAYGLPRQLQKGRHDIDIETVSLFGQVLWKITPDLELGAGARWTDETRTHRQFDFISGSSVLTPLARPRISGDSLAPEFTLTYTPNTDLTVFGAFKVAQKSGSFDTVVVRAPGYDASFGDEKVVGGEFGVKGRTFDRALNFDLSAYYYKYKDLQVGATEITNTGLIAIRTVNAAAAKVYGVELQGSYAPPSLPGLKLWGALNWNHARYTKFDNAPCWGGQLEQEGCDLIRDSTTGNFTAQDLSGRKLLRAPEWTGSFGIDYEKAVSDSMKFTLSPSMSYSSSYYTNILLRDDMRQDSFAKFNLTAALGDVDDRWSLSVIGNNLFDKLVVSNCGNSPLADGTLFAQFNTGGTSRGPSGVDELMCTIDQGRQVWLRLTFRPAGLFR